MKQALVEKGIHTKSLNTILFIYQFGDISGKYSIRSLKVKLDDMGRRVCVGIGARTTVHTCRQHMFALDMIY